MEEIRTCYQFRVKRENDCYGIYTRQGIKVADFCILKDRQVIRDSATIRSIITALEWRYGLNREKPSGGKGNVHDLFYFQCAINGYYIYKGMQEEGRVTLIGRVVTPNDGKYDRDEILLNEILKLWDKRIYWK